jgi:hypothetical protein
MTAYPPECVIHDDIDYESFHLAPGANEGMGMAVLAKVDLEGHHSSQFKCLFFGAGPSVIRVPAAMVLHSPPDHIKDLVFEVPIDTVGLTPPNNTTPQPWKDLLSSVTDRTILVTNSLGDAVDPTPLVTYLSSFADDKSPGGCSTRWAIAATP